MKLELKRRDTKFEVGCIYQIVDIKHKNPSLLGKFIRTEMEFSDVEIAEFITENGITFFLDMDFLMPDYYEIFTVTEYKF